ETHPFALGMLGMHGTAYANKAVLECDLIFSIGSRWDDRIAGKIESFCADAYKIHVDIDMSENSKMLTPDIFCLGDAKLVIEELIGYSNKLDIDPWVKKCQGFKKDFPLKFEVAKDKLTMQEVIAEFNTLTNGEAIVTTDVGQHQMFAAQFINSAKGYNWISSGGAGTMGFGLPAAIGAALGRPGEIVATICGDGGFQMTMCELATAALYKLPVKIIILNNSYLGMVRQWQELFFDNRLSGVDMEGNPDFVKFAECYEHAKGFRITKAEDINKVLSEALAYNDGPCVIEAVVDKTDNVYPMIPSGAGYEKMLLEAPSEKLEKPTGST
ncbi:MAG: acetolactate synthase large subunit, partial [Lentisphaeraceae bacterium]|nr:acetolactate synthase large subunit [Lentisphaeraceae bacterium]